MDEARILLNNGKYDGAIYLCGYTIELAMKYAICIHNGWNEYPPKKEWDRFLKVHDFESLLLLTGKQKIEKELFAEWSFVSQYWDPENRYKLIGNSKTDTQTFLDSAEKILKELV